MREWVVKRRERTRHLIELGGLVAKAGLVELTDDDRATLYGAFLTVASELQGEERDHALALCGGAAGARSKPKRKQKAALWLSYHRRQPHHHLRGNGRPWRAQWRP